MNYTKEQMDAMVDRFLGWKLPKTFSPDCYVKFDRELMARQVAPSWPVGTNLLTADEARAMLEHVLHEPSSSEVGEMFQQASAMYHAGAIDAAHELHGRAKTASAALVDGSGVAIPGTPTTIREFTNELGNRIRITIEGPTSTSDNTLTTMEARELHKALDAHGVSGGQPVCAQPDLNPCDCRDVCKRARGVREGGNG